MRFVADVMLGRLSRWLRLLGFDTRSDVRDDLELLRTASEEGRVLLTRDRRLVEQGQRMGINCVHLSSSHLDEQLVELLSRIGKQVVRLDPTVSRCALCNGELAPVVDTRQLEKVPEKVRRHKSDFWICSHCGKIYWQGRHWDNIGKKINDANACLVRGPDHGDHARGRPVPGADG